ncbi:MAG: metallophosphoesterase [Oscillospiraceae bacterium]|nr:metallophosphoesterase [Oscillospiraceae bacterium]
MGLRILHSADWHMGSAFASFSAEQRRLLQRKQLELPGKIMDLCRREKCDMVLLAGDIFDGIPGRESVEAVKRMLADCGVPVLISPGNHDFCGPGSPWTEEIWPENVHIFKGSMTSVPLPELDCRVYGAGYSSMDCPALLSHFCAQGQERYCLAVLHGDPVNVRSPYCPVSAAQIRQSGLDYLALGHIHGAGSIRQGDTLCGWPGCPMGRGWDETGEKGVWLVTLEEGAACRFLPLDTPRFWDLEADVTEEAERTVAALLPAAQSSDFFRITLTGRTEVDIQKLQRQFSLFPHLTFRDQTEPPMNLWAEAGEDTLRGVYFRMLQDLAQTEETAVLAAEISWKILSGREVLLP